MKKQIIISIVALFLLIIFFVVNTYFTGNVVEEKIKLGYCPTMKEDAKTLSEKENYELVEFLSASEVLFALKNNQIDKAVIGRKAKLNEISIDTKETVLESGYTLVSNKKDFIDYSQNFSIEIYTYLEEEFDFPVIKTSKEEVLEKVKEGKVALIYWEDWNDDFELVVVMNGNEKVKEFRGAFLYEK
jgi:hypothetical protein